MSPRMMKYVNRVRRVQDCLFPKSYGDNQVEIDKDLLGKVRLNIIGHGNRVHLTRISCNPHTYIYIQIFGNENSVSLDQIYIGNELRIIMGQDHPNFGRIRDSVFKIGGGSSVESMRYITFNSRVFCKIGKDCMISNDVSLWNTDAHPIVNFRTGEMINQVHGIEIGDHCWLGEKASVLKNSFIPEDSIIGYNAVVCGKLWEAHAIYAGNPAKLVKTGISWNSNGAGCGYIDDLK